MVRRDARPRVAPFVTDRKQLRTGRCFELGAGGFLGGRAQLALQDALGSRIMFVDTCHASGACNLRLVKDAADANIVVFSATDKDTEAQETNKLGHGVFTYALSQGINGGAGFGRKGLVNLRATDEFLGCHFAERLADLRKIGLPYYAMASALKYLEGKISGLH